MNQESVNAFLDSLRSNQTRVTYEQALRRVCEDPAEFLELMRTDKKAAEARILTFISEHRNTLSGSTIRTWLAAVRSLHDFCEISPALNWKKLIKSAPRAGQSQDRPTNIEEIRKIFNIADLRTKFIICILRSSGVRVGSFDYFHLKDLQPFEVLDSSKDKINPSKVELGLLKVYSGEPEAYSTFVSSECMKLFRAYCEERTRSGEVLSPDSPLVRDRISFGRKRKNARTKNEEPIRSNGWSITQQLIYLWRKVGLSKREFRQLHGFRKSFKTSLEDDGAKSIFVERLMGHLSALDSSYYRPSDQALASEYCAHQHVLFIDASLSLQDEKQEIIREARNMIGSEGARVQTLEQKVAVLTQTINDLSEMLEKFKAEKQGKS